jgi:membrane associated rhomboid family serine protease
VTLVIVVFLVRTIEVPAFAWLGLWFVFQVLSSSVERASEGGGVAWFAHIGGFAFGVLVVLSFRLRGAPRSRAV